MKNHNVISNIKLTVITVVFNDENHIKDTIESIINQDYPLIEYIVIDGKSNDNTLNIIQKYKKKIHTLISENDDGIYDAMHKGIKLASGNYINFMHSGDSFYSSNTVSSVVKKIDFNQDIIYGNYYVKYPTGIGRVETSHKPEYIWKPFFNQQCAFYKTSILKNQPFDTKYYIAADFFFTIKSFSNGSNIYKINEVICNSLKGGFSNKHEFETIKQYYKIIKEFNLNNKKLYYYKKIIWIFFIEKTVKVILPIKLFYFIQNYFRKIIPINKMF